VKRIVPVKPYVHNRRIKHRQNRLLILLVLVIPLVALAYWISGRDPVHVQKQSTPQVASNTASPQASPDPQPGDLLNVLSVQDFTVAQADALAKQNFGASALPVTTGVTKITFR
jgi:hypothetical protein